jgi:cytochrome c-type biogenesis protein CcsB
MYQVTILPMYLQSLQKARNSGDFETANKALQILKGYQHNYGGDVMPSDNKVEAEILYNEHDVFRNLFWQYMLAGLVMFLFVILRIFYDNRVFKIAVNISKVAVIILFLLHTAGLIFRWYISGHAPWTDAYESMIYVGWATMFFGLAFGRKSNLTIASTAFVAAIIMMVAHWNWMDPAISNLVPVLDSYWLMIHVAVIVASYGPFTLGMILGLVALLLMILTTKKNKRKMSLNIQEITIITELALTVGLVMLTIGNFLGGMWANESWGRYWGWDPKETWALISIMVYAFVIHMRLVPGLRGRFAFNWAAIIAFGSILMTYFGVNFYLSGLHSYASGDQIISYKFIGIALGVWLLLGFLAYLKYKKFYFKPVKKKKK